MLRLLRSMVRMNLPFIKLHKVKRNLLSHLKLQKFTATVHAKCLIKMEKALNLYSKIF